MRQLLLSMTAGPGVQRNWCNARRNAIGTPTRGPPQRSHACRELDGHADREFIGYMTTSSPDPAPVAHRAGPVEVIERSYDHPDAACLVRALYEEQVGRCGFADPVDADPATCVRPKGLFVVVYLGEAPRVRRVTGPTTQPAAHDQAAERVAHLPRSAARGCRAGRASWPVRWRGRCRATAC